MAERSNNIQLRPAVFIKVSELRPDSDGVNLNVKVSSMNVVVEKERADGTKIRVAEALVGDASGCILLTARNNQIDVVQPGSSITIRNAKIVMFKKGFMRLSVDKWGSIKPSESPAAFEVDTNNNLSLVEYELVTL